MSDEHRFQLDPRLTETSHQIGIINDWVDVRLADDKRWPWLILVPTLPDIVELSDLDDADCAFLFETAASVIEPLKAVTGAQKANVATIGNVVRQFHLHVVARSQGDPNWPAPIWGHGEAVPYTLEEAQAFSDRLMPAWGANG